MGIEIIVQIILVLVTLSAVFVSIQMVNKQIRNNIQIERFSLIHDSVNEFVSMANSLIMSTRDYRKSPKDKDIQDEHLDILLNYQSSYNLLKIYLPNELYNEIDTVFFEKIKITPPSNESISIITSSKLKVIEFLNEEKEKIFNKKHKKLI